MLVFRLNEIVWSYQTEHMLINRLIPKSTTQNKSMMHKTTKILWNEIAIFIWRDCWSQTLKFTDCITDQYDWCLKFAVWCQWLLEAYMFTSRGGTAIFNSGKAASTSWTKNLHSCCIWRYLLKQQHNLTKIRTPKPPTYHAKLRVFCKSSLIEISIE